MMIAHIFDTVPTSAEEREFTLLLRKALADSPYKQGEAGAEINKHQTWFPNYLFRTPGQTLRRMFIHEPENFEKLIEMLGLDRQAIVELAGISPAGPPLEANEVALNHSILVFEAGAGPALDAVAAVDRIRVPLSNGGSYRTIGLLIRGDSMEPYLASGDTAIIACEPSLVKPGKAIGIYLPESGSVVKMYVGTMTNGDIILRSLNAPEEGDHFVAPAHSRVYGPVIKRLKNG